MIAASPYGRLLGVERGHAPDGSPLLRLRAAEPLEGRPGFLHGGVIAGLMEMACLDAVVEALSGRAVRISPIDVSIDFLRGGAMDEVFAQATILRIGRRFVNVAATCWQSGPERPIATARMHLQITDRARRPTPAD